VLVDGCLVHVTRYEVQGVRRVQGGGGRARQVQAKEEEVDIKSSLLDYYPCCGSGSGSRRAKITHKNRKKF
jgi:hypothetical protein